MYWQDFRNLFKNSTLPGLPVRCRFDFLLHMDSLCRRTGADGACKAPMWWPGRCCSTKLFLPFWCHTAENAAGMDEWGDTKIWVSIRNMKHRISDCLLVLWSLVEHEISCVFCLLFFSESRKCYSREIV